MVEILVWILLILMWWCPIPIESSSSLVQNELKWKSPLAVYWKGFPCNRLYLRGGHFNSFPYNTKKKKTFNYNEFVKIFIGLVHEYIILVPATWIENGSMKCLWPMVLGPLCCRTSYCSYDPSTSYSPKMSQEECFILNPSNISYDQLLSSSILVDG